MANARSTETAKRELFRTDDGVAQWIPKMSFLSLYINLEDAGWSSKG